MEQTGGVGRTGAIRRSGGRRRCKKSNGETKPAEAPATKPAPGTNEKPAEKPAPTPAATEPAKPAGGEPEVPRAIMVTKREITAQLQIFLDQQLFSPGMIDGKPGKFLTNALKRWQRAHALPETGVIDENVPLDSVYPVYTFHTVAKSDYKFVGNLAGKTAEQARQKSLLYPGYTDLLAERYHCSTEFLAKLNPKVSFGKLKPGDEVRVPNVAPFKIEDMPDTGNLPEHEEFKARRIVVTRRDTILELFEGDTLIAAIPIAPGSPAHPTPAGKWRILGIASMPTFRWDAGTEQRRAHEEFLQPATRTAESRRRSMDGAEQAGRRHPRHEQPAQHRHLREPRLHAHGKLGHLAHLPHGHRGRDCGD